MEAVFKNKQRGPTETELKSEFSTATPRISCIATISSSYSPKPAHIATAPAGFPSTSSLLGSIPSPIETLRPRP